MNCVIRYFKSKRERKLRERCLKYALETIGDSTTCSETIHLYALRYYEYITTGKVNYKASCEEALREW